MKINFKAGLIALSVMVQISMLPHLAHAETLPYTPVVTPNGTTLAWTKDGDVKVFHLTANVCTHEIAPGMVINAWCYNGQTPGPTIEAVEGDHVRILVTNNLPEPTAVHWHGVLLPSGMDGVSGLSQKPIQPGDTFRYEFTLKQHGTLMYHSHGDEMVQMGMGAMGFLIIHPKKADHKIDRDYAIFLNEWFVEPGSKTPNPNIMTDFNIFTFNSRAYPGTAPLLAKTGDRVRVRIGNVGQESHPIHLHGHNFKIVATDGGDIPESAQWPETTAVIFPGQTRDFEFIATAGDWAFHCHRRHHPMNAMGHGISNMIGVDQTKSTEKIQKLLPDYMGMGSNGMDDMGDMGMQGPENTLPMMGGEGPFGMVGMGGMFTIVKVRDDLKNGEDPGWYPNPPGTVAESINQGNEPPVKSHDMSSMKKDDSQGMSGMNMKQDAPTEEKQISHESHNMDSMKGMNMGATMEAEKKSNREVVYVCPMHHEVRQLTPGKCPKCGMTLKAEPSQESSAEKAMVSDQPEDHKNMKM